MSLLGTAGGFKSSIYSFYIFIGGDMDVNMKYVLSVINDLRDEWYKPPSGYYRYNKREHQEYAK